MGCRGLDGGAYALARAQDVPTARARIQLYGFGGVSGNFTGVGLAKNLDITAGADLEFRPFFTLYPAVEVRGSYPVEKGNVVSEENLLGGLRLGGTCIRSVRMAIFCSVAGR